MTTAKLYEILLDGEVAWTNIPEMQLPKTLSNIKKADTWREKKITQRLMKECPNCHTRLSGGNKK